jgi:hypothetical protein
MVAFHPKTCGTWTRRASRWEVAAKMMDGSFTLYEIKRFGIVSAATILSLLR